MHSPSHRGVRQPYGRYGYRESRRAEAGMAGKLARTGWSASGVARAEGSTEAEARGRLWFNDGSCVRCRARVRQPRMVLRLREREDLRRKDGEDVESDR